jgi:hypothetical protein
VPVAGAVRGDGCRDPRRRDDRREAVLRYAAENAVDLVAMASHARHGIPRAVIGSVADKVIRGSKSPVLVIRPEDTAFAASAVEDQEVVA